jgi:hypothetical protein
MTVSTSGSTPAGTDSLTITGTSGSLAHSAAATLVVTAAGNFTLSATPTSQTVNQGNGTNYTITVTPSGGFTGTVNLSVSGLPSGASASFNPASVTTSGSSTLTVSTSSSTPAGTYTLTATGTSGSLQQTTTVTLIVNAVVVTWTEVNDTDPGITYSAGWGYSTNRGDADYNDDVHYTKTNGNYAQYTFNGTGAEYITETYSDESNVDIYIDGTLQTTVNCNSGTRQAQVVMYSTTSLSAGSHTIKIVKNGGTYALLDAFAYTAAPVPNFAISVSPSSQTVVAGNSASYTATVTPTNGFGGTVNWSVSGLPSGASGSFNPASVTSPEPSTLTVTTTGSTAPGTYTLTITGISGNLTNTATATLVVNAAPDFSISTSPSSQSVNPGANTTYTAAITALNGFTGTVSFSVSGLPTGATGSFSPNSVNGSGSSTLTVSTTTSIAPGTYTLTVTGTSGSLAHSGTVTLVVNTPEFSISTTPGSQTVTAGGSTNYTATVSAINGFSGTVSFSMSGLPTGATGSFNPTSVNGSGSSTLTVTTAANTPAGTYTLTVSGTSGSLVHNSTASLVVNATSGGLPSGWSDTDVGTPSIAGSASYSSGVFTINGSGADIWGTADQLHFAYESTSGDQTVIARVASQTGANAWAKSGVMIRESTNAGASYVGLYVTPGNGVSIQFRNGTGTSAIDLGRQTGVTAPYWVKLVRSGNTFTGYGSPDGSTWTQVASTNVTMAAPVLAGLPVCSHDNTVLDTAMIDNVSITTPAPDFSLSASPSSQTVSPGNGASYTATVSALNGFNSSVSLTVSGLPSGASGSFNPTSVTGSGSSTLSVSTSSTTPTGTYTLTITGTSGSLVHNATVTLVVSSRDSNIAPSGTAYGWSGMTSSTVNTGKAALPGLNDNNLTVNVDIQPNGDNVNAWEAAGVIWSSTKSISSVDFINGDITSGGDGFLTANLKLQFSTDGSTWADSGWTVSPGYPYSSSAGGKTYTFSGTAVSGKLGARVIGQVRTTDTSYHWIVKEVQIIGH